MKRKNATLLVMGSCFWLSAGLQTRSLSCTFWHEVPTTRAGAMCLMLMTLLRFQRLTSTVLPEI